MIRISVTGPESTGKTELSLWLTERIFGSVLVPEVAREYLELKGTSYRYTKEDLLAITEQSVSLLNEKIVLSPKVLISDTDHYVMHIWWDEVYGETNTFIRELARTTDFDVYLLCLPDLPWQYDPLRENEYDRDRLFERYRNVLQEDNRKTILVRGEGMERFNHVLKELKQLFPQIQLKDI